MVTNHYRWDFIGLSTDTKPTPETSEKVVDGSTFYCSDNSKLYVWCQNQWYEKVISGGGGGGTSDFNQLTNRPKYNSTTMTGSTNIPKVPTATSELNNDSGFITSSALPTVNDATLTITQNGTSKGTFTANDADDTTIALTDTTYSDFTGTDGTAAGTAGLVPAPATTDAGKFLKADGTWDTAGGGGGPTVVQTTGTSTTDVMSQNAVTSLVYKQNNSARVSIGGSSNVVGGMGVALGFHAMVNGYASVALGPYSQASVAGEVNIGSSNTSYGYNNTNYRLISGLYDGQSAHDAVTVEQVNATIDAINTALSTNIPHIGA